MFLCTLWKGIWVTYVWLKHNEVSEAMQWLSQTVLSLRDCERSMIGSLWSCKALWSLIRKMESPRKEMMPVYYFHSLSLCLSLFPFECLSPCRIRSQKQGSLPMCSITLPNLHTKNVEVLHISFFHFYLSLSGTWPDVRRRSSAVNTNPVATELCNSHFGSLQKSVREFCPRQALLRL